MHNLQLFGVQTKTQKIIEKLYQLQIIFLC